MSSSPSSVDDVVACVLDVGDAAAMAAKAHVPRRSASAQEEFAALLVEAAALLAGGGQTHGGGGGGGEATSRKAGGGGPMAASRMLFVVPVPPATSAETGTRTGTGTGTGTGGGTTTTTSSSTGGADVDGGGASAAATATTTTTNSSTSTPTPTLGDAANCKTVTVDCGQGLHNVTFTSRIMFVNVTGIHRIFAFVATCGSELSKWAATKTDQLQRVWAESICEQALFQAVDQLKAFLDKKYNLGGKHSMMNPGSLEDWPLTQQKELFEALGHLPGEIGVTLLPSYFMVPAKTVSGLLIPSPPGDTTSQFVNCQLCPRPVCPGRRAPYDPVKWKEYNL